MDMKKIGEFIATRRKMLGYTQDDLGNVLGISGKAISKWERGLSCPDVSLINRIAVELKVSIAQLLDFVKSTYQSILSEHRQTP